MLFSGDFRFNIDPFDEHTDEALRAAQAKLNSSSEDVKGMARRSVIFRVTSPLQLPGARIASTPNGMTTWETHSRNLPPLPWRR